MDVFVRLAWAQIWSFSTSSLSWATVLQDRSLKKAGILLLNVRNTEIILLNVRRPPRRQPRISKTGPHASSPCRFSVFGTLNQGSIRVAARRYSTNDEGPHYHPTDGEITPNPCRTLVEVVEICQAFACPEARILVGRSEGLAV
jgi:hypothetical protein